MPSSSTKTPILLDRQLGGVDSTSEGFLVEDTAWRQQHNMRSFQGKLQQVPRKKYLGALQSCYPHEILALVNLPIWNPGHGHIVGLTKQHAWQIRDEVSDSVILEDVTGPLTFEYDNDYRRWGTTVYNGQLFFVNELNSVLVCDGTAVRYLEGDVPKAKYIQHFFDHLVLGWTSVGGVVMPGRMQWGDLYRPSVWTPARNNEADQWDFEEDATGRESARGVFGLEKIGDTLYTYTPTSIRPVRYVGLPRVFQVGDNVSGGLGNGLQWGLVRANNTHFFFDTNEQMIFSFDGSTCTPIGGKIVGWLSENVTTDNALVQRTWAYHRPEYYEVVWVFVSKNSSGAFDLAAVYNYRTQTWHTQSVENLHSFGGKIRRTVSVQELGGTVSGLSLTAGELGNGALQSRLWGGTSGILVREETSSDTVAELLESDTPILETKDYHFGNMQDQKEVDTITIHSSLDEGKGVEVRMATRELVDAEVEYAQPHLWTKNVAYGRLTTLRGAGRLFRFKYNPLSIGSATATTQSCAIPSAALFDSLFAEIAYEESSGNAPHDATLIGATVVPLLSTDGYPYVYDEDPEPGDPTVVTQTADMQAACVEQNTSVLYGLGFDSVTAADWEYVESGHPLYALLSACTNYTAFPGGAGGTSFPPSNGKAWMMTMRGFLASLNPTYAGGVISTRSKSVTRTAKGTAAVSYTGTFRVRASAPLCAFTGGTNDGAYLQTGGTPADATHEFVKLQIGAATYYLNRGAAATDYNVAIDYEVELPVTGGDTIILTIDNQDYIQFGGDEYSRLVKVAGFAKTANFFVRVDYSLRLASGTARTITRNEGGGVRGWKWSSVTMNVLGNGAEK